jgi:hypothetical protein
MARATRPLPQWPREMGRLDVELASPSRNRMKRRELDQEPTCIENNGTKLDLINDIVRYCDTVRGRDVLFIGNDGADEVENNERMLAGAHAEETGI